MLLARFSCSLKKDFTSLRCGVPACAAPETIVLSDRLYKTEHPKLAGLLLIQHSLAKQVLQVKILVIVRSCTPSKTTSTPDLTATRFPSLWGLKVGRGSQSECVYVVFSTPTGGPNGQPRSIRHTTCTEGFAGPSCVFWES